MKYDPKTTYIEQHPFNTQIAGKIHDIRDNSVLIQCLHDGECFLLVPKQRIPKVCMTEGTDVTIYLTAKHGRFGITKTNNDNFIDPSTT